MDAGKTLVVIGPSGSGKSTLLRCVNLLEPINSGSIVFDGAESLISAAKPIWPGATWAWCFRTSSCLPT